jgi:hypothetical protein
MVTKELRLHVTVLNTDFPAIILPRHQASKCRIQLDGTTGHVD